MFIEKRYTISTRGVTLPQNYKGGYVMNFDKLTQKSLEALKTAQSAATDRSSQAIEQSHIFYALISDGEGLIPEIFKVLGYNLPAVRSSVESVIDGLPKVSGDVAETYISKTAERALITAEKICAQMKDEYISVEHIMTALFDVADDRISAIFKKHNIKKSEFLDAL